MNGKPLIAVAAIVVALGVSGAMGMFDKNTRIARSLGAHCTAQVTCGDLLYVSCRPEVDGPTFYVDIQSEKVISTCGGACWGRAEKSDCETKCPPPEWEACKEGGG